MPIKNYFDLLKNGKDLNKEGRTFRSIKVENEKPYELSVENYSSIENAIEITGDGKYHRYVLFVCGCCLMGVIAENINMGIAMLYIECDIRISTIEQGILSSCGYAGIVLSSHIWGFLADTVGRRPVLLISTGGSFICGFLSSFSTNIVTLTCTRLCVGVFISGAQAATFSYLGEFHSKKTRDKALALSSVFQPGALIFSSLLAWAIIPMEWQLIVFSQFTFVPWRALILCGSLLNAFNFICLYQLPESPTFLHSMNNERDTLNVLRKMFAKNKNLDQELYPIKMLEMGKPRATLSDVNGFFGILKLIWSQTAPLFRQPHVGNTLNLCFSMFVLFSIGHGMLMWYPRFVTDMQDTVNNNLCFTETNSSKIGSLIGYSNDRFAMVFHTKPYSYVDGCNVDNSNTLTFKMILLMGITYVLLATLISLNIDRINRQRMTFVWLLTCAASAILTSYTENFYVMAISFAIFLSCSICAGIINATSSALFPSSIRAMATCLISMVSRIGSVSGSSFVAILLTQYCHSIFITFAILLLGCSILFLFFNTNPSEVKDEKGIKTKIDLNL